MKKSISISTFLLLLSISVFGQENRIALSAGYPINLTDHWMVDKWEKPLSFDLKFNRTIDYLLIGGGVNYTKYDISWFPYYQSEKNTISNVTPYLQLGIVLDNRIASLIPYINLGYSAFFTDIEINNSGKGGFYPAVGLDCNFNITQKLQTGIGVNYGMIFNKLDFEYEGSLPANIITTEDDIMKSLTLNLNVIYKL